MYVLFVVLTLLVSVLMIGIVLIQKSKGGGLSSQFGGGNQVLGVRGTNTFLEKATWTLAALILVLSVASAYTLPKAGSGLRANTKQATTQSQGANTFDNQAAKDVPVQNAQPKTADQPAK